MIRILMEAAEIPAWILLLLSGAVCIRAAVFYRRKSRSIPDKIPEEFAKLIEEYEVVNENLPVGAVVFSGDGSLLEHNAEGEKLIKTITGAELKKFNPFSDSPCLERSEIQKLRNGIIIDKRITVAGRHIRIMIYPVAEGEACSFLFILSDDTDITDRRKEIENINSVFTKAMAESQIGVCRINLFNNNGYANEAWYKNLAAGPGTEVIDSFGNLTEEDKGTVFGYIRSILDIQLDEQEYLRFIRNSPAGKTLNANIRINVSGGIHWLRIYGELSEYNPEEGRIIVNITTLNIDRQMRRERILEKAYKEAMEAEQLKISFIANMSQEIKQPLDSIIRYSGQLTVAADKSEEKRLFAEIEKTNAVLLELITDIINISKIESGSMTVAVKQFPLHSVFGETIAGLKRMISPGAEIRFPQAEMPGPRIYADREKIQRILACFAVHSAKNVEKGSIEPGYQLAGDKLYLYVKDSARNIDMESRKRLFEMFDSTRKYSGNELGDILSGLYIKMMNGSYGFESDELGSISWCKIPLGESEPQKTASGPAGPGPRASFSSRMNSQSKDSRKKTILIAEDNENNFQLVRYMLKDDYHILHARNGSEAVELHRENAPDLVLMDIKMPVMDGYEAAARIRETDGGIPIIAVTAFTFDKETENPAVSGFNARISKPVNEKELTELLAHFLKKEKQL